MPNPWDQRTGESNPAFRAFSTYRDLGPGRSMRAAFQFHTGRTTGASGRWRAWEKRDEWHSRAVAWDISQQSRSNPEDERRARDGAAGRELQSSREFQMIEIIFARFTERSKFPTEKRRTAVSEDGRTVNIYEPVSDRELIRLAEFVIRAGRLANKMPTEIIDAPPDEFRDLLYESDSQFYSVLPGMPVDPLSKPKIGQSASGNGNGHPISQPGIVRP